MDVHSSEHFLAPNQQLASRDLLDGIGSVVAAIDIGTELEGKFVRAAGHRLLAGQADTAIHDRAKHGHRFGLDRGIDGGTPDEH